MQVSINFVAETGVPGWKNVKGFPEAVCDLLEQGFEVGPVQVSVGDKTQFQSAHWLFVAISQPSDVVSDMLTHTFTEQHAGVVWLPGETSGSEISCLIGFPLAASITDADRYRLLLLGLATVYGMKFSRATLSGWRVSGGNAIALNGVLDEKAVERLAQLGQENRLHRQAMSPNNLNAQESAGYVRSAVRLERDETVRCRDGSEAPLASLAEGTAIYCPIHVDTHGVATVIGQGKIKAAQCPCCKRNYWNAPKERGVDFGHFRQVFDRLRAQEDADLLLHAPDNMQNLVVMEDVAYKARQFNLLREQYLPALPLQKGVTLVRSPKGSGKTEALKELIAECYQRNQSVLLIGHRRALLRSLAERLGLTLYFEMLDGADGTSEFRPVTASSAMFAYAISLDSLPSRLKPDVNKFKVVVVDESEQVIRHLAGATLKKVRRPAFHLFQHYLSVAKSVYLLDADLGMLSVTMALNSATPDTEVRFIVNEPDVEAREFDLVTTREGLMARLQAAVDANKKCYVATNSKKAAERIGSWIAQRWVSKRVEVVHRDNAQTNRVQELLSNIVEEFQSGINGQPPVDVLIGSPTIGTGFDITFPGNVTVVDHVFGLFESGINTHYDIDQQLARVRHPGQVSVWVNRNVMHYETDPAALRNELRNTVLRTDLSAGFTRSGTPIYSEQDKPLVELWSEITSYERASKNELFYHWTALREGNGWTGRLDITSDEEKARGKTAMIEGKSLHSAAQAERIAHATDIDDERGEELSELDKVGGSMTDDDRASLEKYRLNRFYEMEVSAELVSFDDDGRTRRQIEWLEIMLGDQELNKAIDHYEISRKDNPGVIVFDRQFRCAKTEVLGQLLAAAGLLKFDSGEFLLDTLFSTETLGDFTTYFKANRKRIDSELGVVMRRDLDKKPVQQLGTILSMIGIEVVLDSTTKADGFKRRSYRMDGDKLTKILEVIVRRHAAREGRRELAAAKRAESEDGDNVPPIVNDNTVEQLSPDDDRGDVCADKAGGQENLQLAERLKALKALKAAESGAASVANTMQTKATSNGPKKIDMTQAERVLSVLSIWR